MAAANLFAQFAQPVRSVNDYLDQYDQQDARRENLSAQRQQNALQALTMRRQGEADARAAESRNVLARIYAMPEDQRITAARASGNPEVAGMADVWDKAAIEKRDKVSQIKGRDQTTKAAEYDLRIKQSETAVRDIAALESVEDAVAGIQRHLQAGDIDQVKAQSLMQSLPQNPAEFPRWQIRTVKGILSAKERLEAEKLAFNTSNTGKKTVTTGRDPYSGQVVSTSELTNTTTPGEDQTAAVSVANNKRTVGASYANAAAARDQAQAVRDAAKITARASDETGMRKEFADLPEVKKFKEAAPAYKAVVEAAKTNNPQADINLIYGLAKLYDPNSVVREGEYATIANSQAIPEWLKGQAQRLVGGGRLTEGTKKQIVEQANIRYRTMKGDVDGARSSYDDIAKKRGLDPSNVFPKIGAGSEAGPSVTNW